MFSLLRMDLHAFYTSHNRSYSPSATIADGGDQQTGTYYTPTGYTYPNIGPVNQEIQKRSAAHVTNTNNNNTAEGEISTPAHGYEYIAVQK